MSGFHQRNTWITSSGNTHSARLRLFCFPYAGGGSLIFRDWQKYFSDKIEICAVNLPGRGARITEPAISDMPTLVKLVKDGLMPYFDRPFAFMGHSMGAALSFELTRLLRHLGLPLPVKLIVSASSAPHVPSLEPKCYDLPEPELIEELRRLNGTPPEVLNNKELLSILLPLIRADFSVCQTYEYKEEPPLDIPITVLRGSLDHDIPEESAMAWQEQTTSDFNCITLEGDHFFCHSAKDKMIEIISRELFVYTGNAGF